MWLLYSGHRYVIICSHQEFLRPGVKEFRLTANDIELEGHLDGNFCRCTGYKPILQAAKTFITEDLNSKVMVSDAIQVAEVSLKDNCSEIPYRSESNSDGPLKSMGSCGRPGGCCRDTPTTRDVPAKTSEKSSDSGSLEGSSTSHSSVPTDVSGSAYGKAIKSNEKISKDGTEV